MSSEGAGVDAAASRASQAAAIRVRMRRRLIGAAALLVGTAVVVPMMLDPAPRPLPDNIPVDIPSERTPFAPRLSLPTEARPPGSAQGAAAAGAASATAAKPAEPSAAGQPAQGHGGTELVDQPPDSAPASAPGAGESKKGLPAEAGSANSAPTAAPGDAGAWFVQAAALSSENAARQLSERLNKAGMAPFIERTESAGSTLYRVRLGPFPSREAAVKVRRHLHAMGVGSNVVRVAQAER